MIQSHEIDQLLIVPKPMRNIPEVGIPVTDQHSLRMLQDILDAPHHQTRDMGNSIQDKVAIGANKASDIDILVIDPQVISLANQPLDELDHRAFAQIVGSGLEAESKNPYPRLSTFCHDLHRARHLHLVAWENRFENRELQVFHPSLIGEGTQVLWQARTAEGKPWHEISSRDVQFLVLAKDAHDRLGVDAERIAEVSDLVGKPDLESMPTVIDVLHHFRRVEIG